MVNKALIIAAGNGSRLRRRETDKPKPLHTVAGLPLIKRIILTAIEAGIREFVIVVGHQKEKIIEAVRSYELDAKIDFVENAAWQKPNGLSVLAAKEVLKENFVLLMSDHIFAAETLKKLRKTPLDGKDCLLAIDHKLSSIFDMDDATKVHVENNEVQAIGKELSDYNAVDTGMFLCSPELFRALETVSDNGNCSLSDGIQYLSKRGKMGTFDIGEAFWQDVDTKPTLKHAEKILMARSLSLP